MFGGIGGLFAANALKSAAKVFIVHIPYRGFPPAVTDMLGGNLDTMFAIIPGVLPQVKAGKMKALAVTARKRSALAPAATPREVVGRLSAETMKSMTTAEVRDSLGKQGFDVVAGAPEHFARWIRAEQEKCSKVIKASGARAD